MGVLEPALLLYPAYYCLANGALALVIVHRRAIKRRGERGPAPLVLAVPAQEPIAP